LREPVEAGSMPYSAVTQPRPVPDIQRGTPGSTLAVQITCVAPILISAEPVAGGTKSPMQETGRAWSGARS
jgi:hypothetical protein